MKLTQHCVRGEALPRRSKGFTLVEMMVVVAMIALIVAAMAPMVFSTLISTRLTSAGETLAGQISLARQIAVSSNQAVEVRFYQYEDDESPGTKAAYRAVAIMRTNTSTTGEAKKASQLTDTFYLPAGIVFGETTEMSPLLTTGVITAKPDEEKIIRRSSVAKYKAFSINPDGSTNLESLMGGNYKPSLTYVTLGEERALEDIKTVPKNFYAIQIDPTSGRTTTYRP